jgi:nickel-dependent lactate racemase
MTAGRGSPEKPLSEEDVRSVIADGIPARLIDGKRVLVLTPDATRTCPLPVLIRAIRDLIGPRSAQLDFMVALGTHTPLPQERILHLYGISRPDAFGRSAFFNHRWDRPDTFRRIGSFSAAEVEEISAGLLSEEVPIDINRMVFDYDLVLIAGPVFPHEVVGFSGGAKYLFPGISGGDFLHFFHWLGAVLTCKRIIGIKDTPVRRLIDRAMEKIAVPIQCLAMVVQPDATLCGLYAGDVRESWSQAADVSARIHIQTRPNAFRTVLGRASSMYDELWTAGKVMYKLEQVVAQGGTLIIYAPHVAEISRTWGDYIERVGYHTRDYFLSRMGQFRDVPRGVLAHSTHVCGTGVCENGIERFDVNVVLATSIPAEACRRINLGYLDPSRITLADYMNREEEGILFVDHAGEILYRLERT